MATLDEVKHARTVRLQQVLGLQNDGRRVAIKCPFHSEKSASFVIYPDGSWHCYGCQANGQNSIDFCIKMGANFNEAITELNQY